MCSFSIQIPFIYDTFPKVFPCGELLGHSPDSPFILVFPVKTKNAGTTWRWYRAIFSLCSMMWLISLSSRGKWLIVTKRLGTQVICILKHDVNYVNFISSSKDEPQMSFIPHSSIVKFGHLQALINAEVSQCRRKCQPYYCQEAADNLCNLLVGLA